MGGYGSGRWSWYKKKTTVEQCKTISLTAFSREGFLKAGLAYDGSLRWKKSNGETAVSIGITVNTTDIEDAWFQLSYSVDGQSVAYKVRLESRPCNIGGTRWYMVCPLCYENRVLKLHLPPNGRYFGCRKCHDLTYKSSQESDKRVSWLRKMEPEELLQAVKFGEVDLMLLLRILTDWHWNY